MELDTAEWDRMLRQTLEDNRLSNSERQALKARLRDAALDDRARAVLRSRVFEIAREKLEDDRIAPVVDWIEEVSKLLPPFPASTPIPSSRPTSAPAKAACAASGASSKAPSARSISASTPSPTTASPSP